MKTFNITASVAIVMVLLQMMLGSCKKENEPDDIDTIPQITSDFRDDYIGDYSCMRVHYTYFSDTSGWIHHVYDTTWNVVVNVAYHNNDSSILVTPGGDGEQAYIGDSTFECVICSDPKGFTRFFAPDSIYIYQRISVNTYKYFYGHKMN